MQKLFNKILVPVDFSSKSKKALEKAIGIALQYNCSIHLLHVANITQFTAVVMAGGDVAVPFAMIDNKKELEFQLEKLCKYIHLQTDNSIKAEYTLLKGTWNDTIIDFAQRNKIDLVLIGQKGGALQKRRMLLNPDLIAEKANIPVITVPSNRRLIRLYSIVIPITNFLPVRKLMYGIYMALNYDTTIKLLGIENNKTREQVYYYLTKANQLIRDNCNVKVEMETIVSQNVAEAVNQFAMLRSADLIIVNPGAQTKMHGFLSSLLGNIIQKYSAPPVLTVNPA
jgi:nucleotide-binding universal stress UspA family protein